MSKRVFDLLRYQVVWVCKIIVDQQLDSGPFGNVSVRIPGTEEFWVNPTGITFDQVTPADIVKVDINGNVLEGKHEAHPGTFIHREIYRLRKDVGAIVHTHSENTVAHSLLGCQIEPYTQLGAAIFADQGIYQGFTGPVRTSNEGIAIAQALGEKAIVIAKNHGLFTVNTILPAALWDFIIADMAAQIHITAKQLGLNHAEKMLAEDLQKSKLEVREKQYAFMWESYLNRIKIKYPELFVNQLQVEECST